MINQVFIGGHFSSGTRTVQFLLKQFYDIVTKRQDEGCDHDYEEGFSKRPTFAERVLMGERPEFPTRQELPQMFSLKNPEFMFCAKYLKELFPESKFILVVRNGLDQILCDNRCMAEKFAQYFDLKESEYLKKQMEFWDKAYSYAVQQGCIDLTIRLKDIVEKPEATALKLKELLGLPRIPDTSMIRVPSSFNRRNEKYTLHIPANAAVDRMEPFQYDYSPSDKEEYYKIGKTMMDYFGYGL